MAESAGTEVHADPDMIRLIDEDVHVMVTAPDRAELRFRHRLQVLERHLGPERILKELVVHALLAMASDAEGDVIDNVIHDGVDARQDVRGHGIRADRQVSASDIEPDAADGDQARVGHDSADGLGVPLMAVRAQHGPLAADIQAAVDLRDRVGIVVSKDGYAHGLNSPFKAGGLANLFAKPPAPVNLRAFVSVLFYLPEFGGREGCRTLLSLLARQSRLYGTCAPK